MFKGKRKPGQPVGSDIDWFVIPIERIRRWALVLVALLAAGYLAYIASARARRSPEEKASREITSAAALISRASNSGRPGSQLAQARDFLQGARDSFGKKSYGEAFRLAVESQSYARRAMGGAAGDEPGDAS